MDEIDSNNYINQLTLDFLISKNQLQKLNKLRQKETSFSDNVVYDKSRISKLFSDLLNNKQDTLNSSSLITVNKITANSYASGANSDHIFVIILGCIMKCITSFRIG